MSKGKRNTRNNKNKTLKKVENEISESASLKSRLIVVVGVLVFIALFYLLAIHITNKNANIDSNENNNVNENSDYSEILFGTTFNRSESEYLVVFYDKSDEEINSSLGGSVMDYVAKEDNLTTYTVDMSNMYNKAYNTTEDTNKAPSNVDELRINGPTLIKISKGNVVEYIEGLESVKEYLG